MKNRPGKGLLGWLGRQVGYVNKAVQQDVGAKVLYHSRKTQEQKLPAKPDIVLRRTTIDEVIQTKKPQVK